MQDNNDTTPPNQDTPMPNEPDTTTPAPEATPESSSSYGNDSFGSTTLSDSNPSLTEIAAATTEKETTGSQPVQNTSEISTPLTAPPSTSKKKKWMIPAIIAGVLIVLGGTSVAAYNLWYQNPDKVLGDAFVNAIRAKTVTYTGHMDVKGADSSSLEKMTLTVDGKNSTGGSEVNVKLAMTMSGADYTVSGSGLYDKDANLYVKVNDVRKLINQLNTSGVTMPTAFDDLINKVDGAWIKISADDLKEFSEDTAKTQTCVNDVLKKYENDKTITTEFVELYKKNNFIVVKEKLGSKNGSLGYLIDGDKAKAKSFAESANTTTLVKELKKCDNNFTIDSEDLFEEDDDSSTSRVEVWVSRWGHELTKVYVSGSGDDSEGTFTLEPHFNQPVSIVVPIDVITLCELKADFEKAYSAAMQEAMDDAAASSANDFEASSVL